MDEDGVPSQIVPTSGSEKRSASHYLRKAKHAFTTKDGLLGDYDYKFLFTPNLPFMKKSEKPTPFFGLHDHLPVLLALLLGLQHSLAMLAGVITPPIILSGSGGANLETDQQQYLVSTALIVSGILSMVQITRFHIWRTPYFVGTGLISVVGISFSVISVAQGALSQMYANGMCPTDSDGNKLPCPDGYGAILGTSAVCSLTEILLSFLPPKVMLRIFPPLVTGPTVMLIGIHLVESGFKNWAGGSGSCSATDPTEFFALCPNINAPHPLPWGAPEFLGLGFSVFITIILCERFGAPIMKSTTVIWGLLVGCIIAAATGYFDRSGIDTAPAVSFIWVETFKLSVYGPLVLPIMAVYIICACEAIGDITATCDVSRVETEGPIYESRIQGGVLADGLNGLLASLCGLTPVSTFAQNNGVISQSGVATRTGGYASCFFLIIMGVFSKFAASLTAIPSAVIGGMTTFLFTSVAVSGLAIIAKGVPMNRRNRFILAASLSIGVGATLVPTYFDSVFTYEGDNKALLGFLDAIVLLMETGFAVTAMIAMILNLTLDNEIEPTETKVLDPSGISSVEENKNIAQSFNSDGNAPVDQQQLKVDEKV
ncbi:putative purine permease protein [Zalerion maritima]|uniref:Purine permease protein n=1 Tax=Zalerion maritima TaxID=339359 RepID=A0AAD5WV47_9PEZI|nr:putative purine permease protein [Zalerion maritima]